MYQTQKAFHSEKWVLKIEVGETQWDLITLIVMQYTFRGWHFCSSKNQNNINLELFPTEK